MDLWHSFNERDDFVRVRIEAGSRLLLQSVEEATLESRYDIRLAGIETGRSDARSVSGPDSSTQYAENDVLVLIGPSNRLAQAIEEQGLSQLPQSPGIRKSFLSQIGGAAVLIHPESTLLGRTVRLAGFHTRFQLQVLGMRRGTEIVRDYSDTKLARGDSLFVQGPWSRIKQLANNNHDFVVLELPDELYEVVPARDKMPIALAILGGMVALTIFNVIPLVAPIAIYTANALGVSPYPFALAMLIAASAAFSTPVSTPVVTLVVDPGQYRFTTFLKLGLPLLFLTYGATILVAPLIFPF